MEGRAAKNNTSEPPPGPPKGSKRGKEEDFSDGESTDEEHAHWIDIRRLLKVIERDNPNDPFKQHSVHAIKKLVEKGGKKGRALNADEEKLMQNFGADLDHCTPFDRTDPPGAAQITRISRESKIELQKLPAWLRSFIESKYDVIHQRYQYHTHVFLQMLANRMDYRKAKYWSLLASNIEDEFGYNQMAEDHDDDTEQIFGDNMVNSIQERKNQVPIQMDPFRSYPEFLVDEKAQDRDLWSPLLMQRATDAMRAMLLAGASDSDGEEVMDEEEDDSLAKNRIKRKGLVYHNDEEFVYKGPHWEDIVAEQEHFRERARFEVEMEFTPKDKRKELYHQTLIPVKDVVQVAAARKENKERWKDAKGNKSSKKAEKPPKKTKEDKKREKMDKKVDNVRKKEVKAENDDDREVPLGSRFQKIEDQYFSYNPGHPLYRAPKARIRKKARLFKERGVGKTRSSIYIKDPCKGPITRVSRQLHQPRVMEGFHAYINFIVGSSIFKYVVMGVILFNAFLLAAETGERKDRYGHFFNILDSVFLSIYIMEFALKMYSNPVQYWQSGFNIFDFMILLVSIFKAVVEWANGTDIPILRFMIIVRAFRILRGVSLSIHIQVLVSALVETLKNHVLSVVILLVLLMYIAAIVAFYFFSEKPGPHLHRTWGAVPFGMLRLFSFVTMDGWTEVLDEFIEADLVHEGRFFCLICIVLGNFLFSNIFIAIIIMQISEATDSFRKTQTEERESSVYKKQEAVFRRQKLDMRQLLSRQKLGIADDFYELGTKFVRRLRHDDLCDNRHIIFSPLWLDCIYKGMKRTHHTSNILMTLHRKMSDRLVKLNNLYDEGKYKTRGISRARYNVYVEVKAKLRVLKELFLDLRRVPPEPKLKLKLPEDLKVTTKPHAGPPPGQSRKSSFKSK